MKIYCRNEKKVSDSAESYQPELLRYTIPLLPSTQTGAMRLSTAMKSMCAPDKTAPVWLPSVSRPAACLTDACRCSPH